MYIHLNVVINEMKSKKIPSEPLYQEDTSIDSVSNTPPVRNFSNSPLFDLLMKCSSEVSRLESQQLTHL